MTKINIYEAKAHLSAYARRVKAGETIILCDRNVPFAEIRPLSKTGTENIGKVRKLGFLKGRVMSDSNTDFFGADSELATSFMQSPLPPRPEHL
ncbi:MAG: hypothetical protein SGI71_13040 [Verrucomicrobiota bacterium]|nr:hypothetical protein [Verrucomicrobiota bacterium]